MGRPAFKVTDALRRRVSILAAARMPKVDIARALGCDEKTLDKHFSPELTVGIAKRNAEVLVAMFKSARGGNVAAQKAWIARQDVMPETPRTPAPAPTPEAKPAKLGKKEELEAAANAEPPAEWGVLVKH